MGATEVVRHTHAKECRRLIDAITVRDDQDGHPMRQDRGYPEEAIQLLVTVAMMAPMDHNQPRSHRRQQRAGLVDRPRHNHPASCPILLVDLPPEEVEKLIVARDRQNGGIDHTLVCSLCRQSAYPCIPTGALTWSPWRGRTWS